MQLRFLGKTPAIITKNWDGMVSKKLHRKTKQNCFVRAEWFTHMLLNMQSHSHYLDNQQNIAND